MIDPDAGVRIMASVWRRRGVAVEPRRARGVAPSGPFGPRVAAGRTMRPFRICPSIWM
jgi:hypothetical protein